ncbi:hypothetical protein [Thermococcus sp. 2319x1]|uniref:hypothetical protein n=1 Tax=Thermococcus sp. 2319x1 TaxID=1674923 RepID=UPI0011874B03|nr:hypothetical protein [Thermococcus sp. 2319x1]
MKLRAKSNPKIQKVSHFNNTHDEKHPNNQQKLLFFCILSFLIERMERKATVKNERVLKKSPRIIMMSETTKARSLNQGVSGFLILRICSTLGNGLNKPIKRKKLALEEKERQLQLLVQRLRIFPPFQMTMEEGKERGYLNEKQQNIMKRIKEILLSVPCF